MPLPNEFPDWATDANYPAGVEPEANTPTKEDPERQAIGWRPNEKPTAQGDNYRSNLVGAWLRWAFGDLKHQNFHASAWAPEDSAALDAGELDGGQRDIPVTPDELYFPINLPVGAKLDGFRSKAWQAAGGAEVTIEIYRQPDDVTVLPTALFTYTETLAASVVTDVGDTSGIDLEIEDGFTYFAWIFCDAANVRLGNTKLSWYPTTVT